MEKQTSSENLLCQTFHRNKDFFQTFPNKRRSMAAFKATKEDNPEEKRDATAKTQNSCNTDSKETYNL